MTHTEIREAKDELYRLSMDEKERERYYLREKSIRDEISALANAEEKGILLSKREDILENLAELGDVTDFIRDIVNNQSNIEILKKWIKLAIISDSIEEFIAKM